MKHISNNEYMLNGTLELNNIKKEKSFKSEVVKNEKGNLNIKSNGKFNLTEFELTPQKMMFLEVRNQVDLTIKIDTQVK